MSFEDGFNIVVAIIGLASFIGLLIITGPIFAIAMLVFWSLCGIYSASDGESFIVGVSGWLLLTFLLIWLVFPNSITW